MTQWRMNLHEIIYEADTPAGKLFDVVLLVAIVISVLAVVLESVNSIKLEFGDIFNILEWVFTVLFSIEYILRILCVERSRSYIFSFYGVIDLLTILPAYLGLFLEGVEFLMVIRGIRLLRIYRVLKLGRYVQESEHLLAALRNSRRKIIVFLMTVLIIVLIAGSAMYLVEGADNGYTSIPRGMYWAIVTMTTVGYGDIAPSTPLGQFLSSFLMVMGYAILAVPTGVVTHEMIRHGQVMAVQNSQISTQACSVCSLEGHDVNAKFCKYCGGDLNHV